MQKHNIYLASRLVAVWNWRRELPMLVGKRKEKTVTVLDLNLSSFKLPAPVSEGALDHSPERTGSSPEREENMRTAGQAETAMSKRQWECQKEDRIHFFLVTGQKMNMSARVAFGKGRLTPKKLSFAFPQTDSLRKGSWSAGGKRRMFSFSLRCRLGIIRGGTKGKADCNILGNGNVFSWCLWYCSTRRETWKFEFFSNLCSYRKEKFCYRHKIT